MYKKIALGLLCLLAFASKLMPTVLPEQTLLILQNLTKEHSDNAYLQLVSQTIAASSAQPMTPVILEMALVLLP
jgi:hypothetical protein